MLGRRFFKNPFSCYRKVLKIALPQAFAGLLSLWGGEIEKKRLLVIIKQKRHSLVDLMVLLVHFWDFEIRLKGGVEC